MERKNQKIEVSTILRKEIEKAALPNSWTGRFLDDYFSNRRTGFRAAVVSSIRFTTVLYGASCTSSG